MKHRDTLLNYFAQYRASGNSRERVKRSERPGRRSDTRRQPRRRASDVQYSDEALAALTRGLHMPASQGMSTPERTQGDTFETTYPRHPFAPLVRMAIALVEFVSRRLSG